MDNRLLEDCIKTVLEAAHADGLDIMRMAKDLSDFHSLIQEDDGLFSGYKTYSLVSRMYYRRLNELGLLDDDEDV